jgi:hypothetical protein
MLLYLPIGMVKVRANAEAALQLSKEKMKKQYEHNKKTAHTFNIGGLVWLQAKDIKIHQKSSKLGPYQLGPFKVVERISDLDFKLDFVAETRLDAAEESNRGSRRQGVKRLDALTHTAIAYAATSP